MEKNEILVSLILTSTDLQSGQFISDEVLAVYAQSFWLIRKITTKKLNISLNTDV